MNLRNLLPLFIWTSLAAASQVAGAQAARPAGISDDELFGTAWRDSKWLSMPIAVCWENGTQADSAYRAITRKAVEETWERNSAVRFSGWAPAPNAHEVFVYESPTKVRTSSG